MGILSEGALCAGLANRSDDDYAPEQDILSMFLERPVARGVGGL